MSKTRGLTLGKFVPLHKGHQLVIETALREMDEVMAIIYDCPETTDVPCRFAQTGCELCIRAFRL